MLTHILPAGLVLAWLVTPESIRLVNVATGLAGATHILSLFSGALLAAVCAGRMNNIGLYEQGYTSDYSVLKKAIGNVASIALIMSARVPFFLYVSTALLVTAGFAFNEVFLYWFPNFLFASILLVLLAVLQIFKEQVAMLFQTIFVSIALAGILLLVSLGMFGETPAYTDVSNVGEGFKLKFIALGFISFLGFDFHKTSHSNTHVYLALLLGFVVLSSWSIIALKYVEPARLAESSIAHLFVAKAVAGEFGRFVMGIIVISGVLAGVNGLFIVIRRIIVELVEDNVLPKFTKNGWCVPFFFATVIEIMMMTGVAGEEILEIQVVAAIMLWLFYVVIRTLSSVLLVQRNNTFMGGLGYTAGAAVLILLGGIFVQTPESWYALLFILKVLTGAMVLTFFWTKLYINNSLNN